MTDEQKKEDLKVEDTQASLTITKEVAEKMEEGFRKLEERLEEKQKAFKFHGSETLRKELIETEDKFEASKFIRAIARDDREVAAEFSTKRAASLGLSAKEIMEDNIVSKAISSAGSAGSNYLVPTVFETEILGTFDTYSEIIADADVQFYNRPGYLFSLNELDTRVVAWWTDEDATGLTASQPTFSEPQIAVTDLMASVDITQDFLEDTETDIMSNLSKQFGEEFAKKIQARLINGDVTLSGVVTKGVLNSAGLNEVLITNPSQGFAFILPTDVENMWFDAISVDHFQNENQNGTFYMNGMTMYNLRKNIRSGTAYSDYVSIFDPVAMTLLGKPVKFSNQFPTPTTTVSDPFVLYGNLKNHLKIRIKRGMTMKVNDQGTSRGGRNLNYQLGRELVVSQRIGHQVVLAEGLTVLAT